MESLFLVLVSLVASPELISQIHGQVDSLGFISIDCGIAANSSYSDQSSRGLLYVSDASYVDAGDGLNAFVRPPYDDPDMADRYRTVRYFPGAAGERSCYTLGPVAPGGKYLVRTAYCYGNYDGMNELPIFDLHLGVNHWATINVTAAADKYIHEAVVVAPAGFLQVCLVNRGLGTPFISGLDLRPLKSTMYPEATANQSLLMLSLSRPSTTFAFNRYHFWPSAYPVYRDLSNNSLYGPVPDFLAQMLSLSFLDLSSNELSGSVPAALLEKSQNGSLVLRIGNNQHLCVDGASTCDTEKKTRNRILVISIVVPIAVATLLFVAAFLIIHRMRKNQDKTWMDNNSRLSSPRGRSGIYDNNRQFTYKELKLMTENFREEIGRGGFGPVFKGYLDNETPVAVKMRSNTSSQGDKEFLAEAQHLTRIHHRNLVSLIGYCKDKKHMALVYEYMNGGNLEDRLQGDTSGATSLTWHQRLKIAIDSAHGLEYLHKSCQPPLIHRDVKTKNILLSADLVAKIADFGLMKAFADDFRTHVTTQPAGTLGYLDPEYYNTSQLSEKSDVYSFGVVLLELITGQQSSVPVSNTESIHVAQWVRQKLSEGDITGIADPKMGGEYDVNSVWKVTELALQCKEQPSRKRPAMTDIVLELKECLELEVSHAMSYDSSVPSSANNLSAASADLQSDAQASQHMKQQTVLELQHCSR